MTQTDYAKDLNARLKAAGHRPLLATACKCLKCVTCKQCHLCQDGAGCPDCKPGATWR